MVQHLTYYFSSYSQVFADNYTFSAKERDSETGLSYFGSRYYSSDLSIWLSVDPQAAKYASLSPYNYCANNPVKLVDPNGEEWETPEDANYAQHLISIAQTRQKQYAPSSKEYELLQEGIDGLISMGKDKSQVFCFKQSDSNNGFVSLLDDGTICINYVDRSDIEDSKNGSAWHEVIHLTRRNVWKTQSYDERKQSSTRYWGFENNKLGNNNNCNEEYLAYSSQLVFSPQSMPTNDGVKVNNDEKIKKYIQKHYGCPDDHQFVFPYIPK